MPAHPKKNISYVPLGEVFSARLLALMLRAVNELIDRLGGVTGAAMPLRDYTAATLPDAASYPNNMVYVSDEAALAYSDGLTWLSVADSGLSVSTLQNAYDNSSSPEILTDATRLGVTIRRGSGADTDVVLEAQNNAGSTTFSVTGAGVVTGTLTNCTGLPLSTGVTGDLPFASFVQAGSAGFVGATGAGDYAHRTIAQTQSDLSILTTTAAAAAYQPLDGDLTSIAALTTTAAGRSVLEYADPGADQIMFWDDSASKLVTFTSVPPELTISGTTLQFEHTLWIAASDETTAITTGTNKATFVFPFDVTVTGVGASLNTVSSSGTPTIDINESGTTILSTKITIDVSEKTSLTAATAPVISDSAITAGNEIGIDIDTAGTGAKGLKVWIKYRRTT